MKTLRKEIGPCMPNNKDLSLIEVAGSLRWPVLAAFHPVNAVVMFWVTVTVARQAQRWRKERAGTH
jgi:hypothetical protein